MTYNKTTRLFQLFLLSIFSFFSIEQAAFASRDLNADVPVYYLKGTLEQAADFNFTIEPGSSLQNSITIVNNQENKNDYTLAAVDTTINQQQLIVFKTPYEENPYFQNWLQFKSTEIAVPEQSYQTIPFSIKIPKDATPGTYYGGISITAKQPLNKLDAQTSGKINTRYILAIKAHVLGEVLTKYNISNLSFDQNSGNFNITIENQGNNTLRFAGTLDHSINNFYFFPENKIETIENTLIPPSSTVTISKNIDSIPSFGNIDTIINGQIEYLDGPNNEYFFQENVHDNLSIQFFSWLFFIAFIISLLLFLLVICYYLIKQKNYLKECALYIVQENETLEAVANKFNIPWQKLAKINNIKPPFILKAKQQILVHTNKTTPPGSPHATN